MLKAELTSVAIEPTNACNLKCGICHSSRPRGFMRMGLYESLIDEINTIPTIAGIALYLGGEPFVHRDFIEMLDYLPKFEERKYRVTVSTNAMLLDDEKMAALVRNGINRVHVSMDGLGTRHEEKRVGSRFETVMRNIERLTEMKQGLRYYPMISVNMVISDQEPKEVDEFVEAMWKKVNVVVLDALHNLDLRYESLDKLPPAMKRIEGVQMCTYPWNYMGIMWNGDVQPCCCELNGRLIVGNVMDDGIMRVFNGKRMKEFRKMHEEDSVPKGHLCEKCELGKRILNMTIPNPNMRG